MYIHRVYAQKVHRHVKPDRYKQEKEIKRWRKDGGDEYLRFIYPLSSESIVFDVGGYVGEWSIRIYDKYKCRLYIFEPVETYAKKIREVFKESKGVNVFSFGISGRTRKENITIDEFSSSIFKKNLKKTQIQLVDIVDFCSEHSIKEIALIKINIEGGEYELLERIIDSGLIKNIKYIQVQFHNFVPDAESKMLRIQRKLSKTHKQKYSYWFIWDGWERKDLAK